jgi:putative peptide zinc metalloprotease protein
MRNRLLTFLTAWIAAFAIAVAPVQADTAAIAVNTTSNSTLIKIVFDIEHILSGPVTTSNAAVAVSSCTSCQTLAIAFQIVLATQSPTVVVPENLALALNINCSTCKTLAGAFQYVYAGGELQLTKRGLQEIMRIRAEVLALQDSGLTVEEIMARAEALNKQLIQVLSTELVPADQNGDNQTDAVGLDALGAKTTPAPTDTTPSSSAPRTEPGPPGPPETAPQPTPTDTTPTDTGPTGATGPSGTTP